MKKVMQVWPIILNKEETTNINETYFFDFTDNKEENCALKIDNGTCQYIDGKPESHTIKITIKTTDWIAILAKELEIKKAITDGKLSIEGNDDYLEKFEKYFSGDPNGTQVNIDNYIFTENEKEILEGKWKKPKKVLALIGSPRGERGGTAILYSIFKQGLDESGCEVDTVYLKDLENKTCKGCFTCWYGKDKKCVHKDDVYDLIHKLTNYDLLVLAAPVYVDGLPGALKNFFDRTISLLDPEFVVKDDHCRHPCRYPKMPHIVLLSPCGFTEKDNFYPMVDHVKEICKNMHLTYLGEILVPAIWILANPNLQPLFMSTFKAIKQAGTEIIATGKIADETNKQISKEIFTRGQLFSVHNRESH
ncbi:MAG: hypothetical protein FK733_03040 [Asgard group archaeon]|nr:hypothetical protein [Asgard group archaeon]